MSSADIVAGYLAERSRPIVLVPLALLLAGAGWVMSPASAHSAADFAWSAAQAFILILAFRVWDDLEDRPRDAVEHPARVSVVAPRLAPLVSLGVALGLAGVASIVLTTDALRRIAALGFAVGVLLVWYRLRRAGSASVLGGHLVLIKYPAIAVAVAPRVPAIDAGAGAIRTAAMLAAVYLALCVYESADDPVLRASSTARGIAIAELALLVPLIVASVYYSGAGLS